MRDISDSLLLAEQEAARLRTALAQAAAEIASLKAELKRRAKHDNCASAAGRVNKETAGLAPAAAGENGEGREVAPEAAEVAAAFFSTLRRASWCRPHAAEACLSR